MFPEDGVFNLDAWRKETSVLREAETVRLNRQAKMEEDNRRVAIDEEIRFHEERIKALKEAKSRFDKITNDREFDMRVHEQLARALKWYD